MLTERAGSGVGDSSLGTGESSLGCESTAWRVDATMVTPRSVSITLVSDPSACSLAGLRPSHQRGTPPLLPERSAVVAAFDRGGSDQFEPGTNVQRGSGASLIRKETETPCRGTSVSGCRPGSIPSAGPIALSHPSHGCSGVSVPTSKENRAA